jgi:hypothetical protein
LVDKIVEDKLHSAFTIGLKHARLPTLRFHHVLHGHYKVIPKVAVSLAIELKYIHGQFLGVLIPTLVDL